MSKNPIFWLKMAKNGKNWPFLVKNGQTRIFFKNPLGTFFQPRQDATLCQVSEKSDARISGYRVTDERTNGRTDERESIGPSANAERPISWKSFSKNNSQGVQIRKGGQGYMSRLTVFIRQAYNTKHSTEIGREGTVPYPIICLGCLYFYTSGRCTIPNTVPQQVREVLCLTQWLGTGCTGLAALPVAEWAPKAFATS